jgi:CBS domain-containing protein
MVSRSRPMSRSLPSLIHCSSKDGIVQLMERRRIKRVPVMEGDALVGIVSRADLLRAPALVLEKQSGEIPSDEEILEQIHAELAKMAWVPRDGLSITVKDGVVDLNDVILEEREREALRVVAENVAGQSRGGSPRLDRTRLRGM